MQAEHRLIDLLLPIREGGRIKRCRRYADETSENLDFAFQSPFIPCLLGGAQVEAVFDAARYYDIGVAQPAHDRGGVRSRQTRAVGDLSKGRTGLLLKNPDQHLRRRQLRLQIEVPPFGAAPRRGDGVRQSHRLPSHRVRPSTAGLFSHSRRGRQKDRIQRHGRSTCGYCEPYATNHVSYERDQAFQEEVRKAALTLFEAVAAYREGRQVAAGSDPKQPRQK